MRYWQKPRADRSPNDSLTQAWTRWTDVVDLFALRRPGRKRIDPRWYAALHRELLASCRASAAEAVDQGKRDFFNRLESIVEPWLTPRVLARTDREILADLLSRCREVERELTGRRSWEGFGERALWFVLPTAAAVVGLLLWWARGRPAHALWGVQDWLDVVWLTVRRSSDLQRTFVAGLVIIVVSIIAVSRTARS